MKTLVVILLIVLAGGVLALWLWRQWDHRLDQAAVDRLTALQPSNPGRFEPAMVAGLPEPARRYFLYTIAPDTPLYTVACISMAGRFGMGNRDKPDYLEMRASQVLAMPAGFVWKMNASRGLMRLSGSDTEGWTRFWLMELLPVARAGGDPDHTRSAFGRYVAEAVFWSPASVLPGPGIRWELVDENTARVTVRSNGLEQAVDVTVAKNGQPEEVSFFRWSNANPEKVHRLQPFGGYLSEFRDFGGFRLPTRVAAGNFFGTEDYFPFFVVSVTDITFPGA
ncbi:DUF4381 domain-containing protein [Marinobacter sp. F4206]|uniref:DUF4381 domain-containing protein n=1 Tax=Marinobacter sp. F4206 TaxID=2861777 RepID=UPI001C5D16E3|nr:DUF4381 domain-containing protein [Marinobacter sp. F4206]MBW4935866.1 DUF4381 domain-containing protein [Marinobacter sp. F4206]